MAGQKISKITRESVERLENIEEYRMYSEAGNIFAKDVIRSIEIENSPFPPDAPLGAYSADSKERILSARKWLAEEYAAKNHRSRHVRAFYSNSARTVLPELSAMPAPKDSEARRDFALIAEERSMPTEEDVIENLFDPEVVSDEMFIQMLHHHVHAFEQRQKEFGAHEPEFRSTFLSRLQHLDSIPLHIKQSAASRLWAADIQLVDPLAKETHDVSGEFDTASDGVLISGDVAPEYRERTYTHEMLHYLSGQTIVNYAEYDEEQNIVNDPEVQRVGLRFYHFDPMSEEKAVTHFHWLNEAVTEQLTIEMLGAHDSHAYKSYRNLFKVLRTEGPERIPRELFVNAYFEDYDPTRPTGERIPEWKKLHQAIDDAYDPGFLVRLDAYVQLYGAELAAAQIRDDWCVIMDTEIRAERISKIRRSMGSRAGK